MASILYRVMLLLFGWNRWTQQHLQLRPFFSSTLSDGGLHLETQTTVRVRVAASRLYGTAAATEEKDREPDSDGEAPADMVCSGLPDVGTLARVWADEQAAQQAERITHELLSRPIRLEDVGRAGSRDTADRIMPLTALLAPTSRERDEESLRLRHLWADIVRDDTQGW